MRLGLLAVCWASAGHATVTEPNGVVVPTDSTGGGEMRLDAFFASKGEPIDWRADAFATPDTFSPLCGFRATLERVDSGSKFGVGWYNVDPNATTPPTQVFEIIPQNASPGQVFTGDDIRSSSNYAGGLIGFALIRTGEVPAYHYSEAKWNTWCDLGCLATPGNWVLSLTYQSKNTPNAWYMGFEDGSTSNLGWNNDGDFNDSLFFFEGLSCAGSGQPCTVDAVAGECASGVTQCIADGVIECRQITEPSAEICDAIDNDCNGSIDDGPELCGPDEVCHRGRCEPRCGRGEFSCLAGEVCVGGVCVDRACAEADCAQGEQCISGQCVIPCDGVVCPGEQICRLGACVDPCSAVACEDGQVCQGGVCIQSCGCRGCDDGLACQGGPHPLSGRCVEPACLDVTCEGGTTCSGGTCVALCDATVRCPVGDRCESGACVPEPESDAGTASAGNGSFGGGFGVPEGPVASTGGFAPDSGGTVAPGDSSGLTPVRSQAPSCGCRVGTPRTKRPVLLSLLSVFAAVALGRRARRCKARRSHQGLGSPSRFH